MTKGKLGFNCLHDNWPNKRWSYSKQSSNVELKRDNFTQHADSTHTLYTAHKTLKCNCYTMLNLTFYFNRQFIITFSYNTVPAHFTSETDSKILQLLKQQCTTANYSSSQMKQKPSTCTIYSITMHYNTLHYYHYHYHCCHK